MKIVIIGANGTIGKLVTAKLRKLGHEVIPVGRTSGDFHANLESRDSLSKLFKDLGKFDAVVNASGDVAFAPLDKLGEKEWNLSLQSKLLGQIRIAQEAVPYLQDRGSITLVSGVLGEEHIFAGVAAATVNKAIESFAQAAALELPRGIRINVVSPTLLQESVGVYGNFFPGFEPVAGEKVATAFAKAALGVSTGTVIKVY